MALRRGALDLDVDLAVGPGQALALVGPNGAGKTSVLRALAGLDPLDAGSVELGGRVLEDTASGHRVPAWERPVGLAFQDHRLFPHLDVAANVAFGPGRRGRAGAAARAEAGHWIDLLGLAPISRCRPDRLSGGQAQRVALARALAGRPGLLLLDEPLASLDAASRVEVRRLLADVLASWPGVALVVTHDPVDAATLAGRVAVVEGGRVAQQGTLAELSARPRTGYVAELVGVNLYRGRAGPGLVHLDGGSTLATSRPVGPTGTPVVAVVHPRAVALHRHRPAGTPRNVWPGRVVALEVGASGVRVRVAGQPPVVAEVTPGAVSDLRLAERGPVWVAVKATEVSVYPG